MSSERHPPQPAERGKRCAKCGACTAVCPVYRASGKEIYSARGKRHLAEVFKEERPGPVYEDIYSKCLLCGACSAVCPQKLEISQDVIEARAGFSLFYGEHGYQKFLARKALNRPELLGAARVLGRRAADILFGRLPAASGLRLRLAMFAEQTEFPEGDNIRLPEEISTTTGAGITYFPGCAARYLYPEIVESIQDTLAASGHELDIPKGLTCCGLATLASGHPSEAADLAKKNIRRLELTEGPILVSCGSCFAHLAGYGRMLENEPDWKTRAALISERVVEISTYVQALLKDQDAADFEQEGGLRVFYHDPCHLRHDAAITEEPRTVLRSLPGVELLELPGGPQCCGQGGLFHLGAPELSARIRDDLAEQIIALKPQVVTTTCSGCLMQLRSAMAAAGSQIPVIHLAALVRARSVTGRGFTPRPASEEEF